MIPFRSDFVEIFIVAAINIYVRIATIYVDSRRIYLPKKYKIKNLLAFFAVWYHHNACDTPSCNVIHKNTNLTFQLKI